MSAFICGPDHFKELALFAVHRRRCSTSMNVDSRYLRKPGAKWMADAAPHEVASWYADVLYQENIRSVRTRYPKDKWDGLPGPNVKPIRCVVSPSDRPVGLPVVALLKMCDCLEYQSCESEDYRGTLAFELLEMIRGALIHALPGYDDAPWDFDAAEYLAKRRAA